MSDNQGYQTFDMNAEYVGEDTDRAQTQAAQQGLLPSREGYDTSVTHYMDEAEREQHLMFADEQGLLRDSQGTLIDTTGAQGTLADATGGYTTIMDASGQMYGMDQRAEERAMLNADPDATTAQYVHHSSLAPNTPGRPVASYGEDQIEDGELKAVSNASGHYGRGQFRPGSPDMTQRIVSYGEMGVDLDDVNVHLMQTKDPRQLNPDETGGTTLPAVDATVEEFLDAGGDQELLMALQQSAYEVYDPPPPPAKPPTLTAEEVAEIKSQSKTQLNEQNVRDGYFG